MEGNIPTDLKFTAAQTRLLNSTTKMLLRDFKGAALTVETLPGKVVVQQSGCHPHDAQDEQSEKQEQHHSLIHPRHDTLRKPDPQVHAQMIRTFQLLRVSIATLIATFLEPANPSDSVKK